MYKKLISSDSQLRVRGYINEGDITDLCDLDQSQLLNLLDSPIAVKRTAAAKIILPTYIGAANKLLDTLQKEKCLYTKIAICECLEKGSIETAEIMVKYLGKIGNNQYKTLPSRVSAKKSFPLPRDIIARTLGKMDIEVLETILNQLENCDTKVVSEAIDAVGYMAFYNELVDKSIVFSAILHIIDKYNNNDLIIWKCALCLSSIRTKNSIEVLLNLSERNDIVGLEAKRSIKIIKDFQK